MQRLPARHDRWTPDAVPDATPDAPGPADASPPSDPPSAGSRWRQLWVVRWWPLTVPLALVLGLALGVGALFALDYRTATIPPVGEAAIEPPTVLLGAQGQELGKLDPSVVGEEVDADELPDHVVRAIMAAEDTGFREHEGFSVRGSLRAAWANLRSGEIEQGGSTITQQYVDLTTPGSGRTFRAKLDEVATAARLENELGKDEILDRYLNIVPFGRDAIGIDQAARVYFRVPATELDVNQAATLAGMIAAPSAYDPERNPDGARARRNGVLETMATQGWLATDRAEELADAPLPEVSDESLVQFGASAYVVDAVRRQLSEELGQEGLTRGLVVRTTIDRRMQRLAQETLRQHVGEEAWTGAIVSIDPATGEVRALVGGPDYASQQFNAAVQAQRQPGSAFKPFTLAAFVEAGYDPSEVVFDAPPVITVGSGDDAVEVGNFGGQGFGRLTVREATVNSVNTVYMQMVQEVTPASVVALAHEMGIDSDLPEFPSIALGTGAVTPYELTSAYATFAAGGVHRAPSLIRSVEETDGEVLYESEVVEDRAIEQQTAGVVTDVLEQVVQRGTGVAAQIGRPIAGKTGTTDDSRDAWFAGYAGQLATVVWMGNLDNTPMPGATGGGLAAPAWSDYMAKVMEPIPVVELPSADSADLDDMPDDDEVEVETRDDPEPTPAPPSPTPPPEPTPTTPSPTPSSPSPAPSSPSPEDTPAPEETSPSPEDTSPAPEESSPSPSPEDTSPAPEDTSPPSEEESPSPDDTSTSEDDGGLLSDGDEGGDGGASPTPTASPSPASSPSPTSSPTSSPSPTGSS